MVPTRVALPPKVRAVVYYVYGTVGVVLGAIQVGHMAAAAGQPVWLTVSLAVFPFLGAGFSLTAATNTQIPPAVDEVELGRRVDLDPPSAL